MRSKRIGVIGAGLGGLSAACTLAARGHEVVLFDKNDWTGGKAARLQEDGFRFDMGPTILIYPSVLEKIFEEAKRPVSDYLALVKLDPQWRCFFSDGSTLDLRQNPNQMAEALASFAPTSADGYRRFFALSEELHEISKRFFFWRSIGSIWDTFEFRSSLNADLLRDISRMRLGATVAGTIRKEIKDPRVAQMLDHLVQYIGSSPEKSPAILCAIGHMQSNEGVWYPVGGTRAIPEALTQLAEDLGVEVRTGVGIAKILQNGRSVTGVLTENGESVPLAGLVANSDTVRAHRELLTPRFARRFARERSYEPACSGVVLYLGLKQRYPHLAHHSFVFSGNPHTEFDAIYRRGVPASDPTCYLCAPATTDPQVAPEGGEALYVLVHTPYLRPGQNWKEMFPAYRRVIFDKLGKTAGLTDLEQNIVFEKALTPEDIEQRYRVWKGAIYGLASHGRLQGGFKPANRSRHLHGLYFAGGSAHPGPGMPMVLMSGWIAADTLDRDYSLPEGKAVLVSS